MKNNRMEEVAIPIFSPNAVQTPNAWRSKNSCISLINPAIVI
jgi:hypothetical protein